MSLSSSAGAQPEEAKVGKETASTLLTLLPQLLFPLPVLILTLLPILPKHAPEKPQESENVTIRLHWTIRPEELFDQLPLRFALFLLQSGNTAIQQMDEEHEPKLLPCFIFFYIFCH